MDRAARGVRERMDRAARDVCVCVRMDRAAGGEREWIGPREVCEREWIGPPEVCVRK